MNFCYHNLRTGGHFLCKFYAGAEDSALEKKLKKLFEKVYREKPDSSRNVSSHTIYPKAASLTCDRRREKRISWDCDEEQMYLRMKTFEIKDTVNGVMFQLIDVGSLLSEKVCKIHYIQRIV